MFQHPTTYVFGNPKAAGVALNMIGNEPGMIRGDDMAHAILEGSKDNDEIGRWWAPGRQRLRGQELVAYDPRCAEAVRTYIGHAETARPC